MVRIWFFAAHLGEL